MNDATLTREQKIERALNLLTDATSARITTAPIAEVVKQREDMAVGIIGDATRRLIESMGAKTASVALTFYVDEVTWDTLSTAEGWHVIIDKGEDVTPGPSGDVIASKRRSVPTPPLGVQIGLYATYRYPAPGRGLVATGTGIDPLFHQAFEDDTVEASEK